MFKLVVAVCLLAHLPWPKQAAPAPQPDRTVQEIIAATREKIPGIMARDNIPGLAVVLVDETGVLWAEGFGYTDDTGGTPVTPDTIFSLQSMSKSFTALAALMAVQDGLVDLATPVSAYLPEYQVNSIFEERPLDKITLADLLSHTAGFPHEAPVGGNYTAGGSFEEHVLSIQGTWLRHPVGSRWTYSNLGIDLAGYILQVRSGVPYTDYVSRAVYAPLGMDHSAFATPAIRTRQDRAIGHSGGPIHPPVDFLILPSGGVYASANDMGRYLLFHVNQGRVDGQPVLREDLAELMLTYPSPAARLESYALGVGVSMRNGARRVSHGGAGFGFMDDMIWYPELKLGAAVLANRSPNSLQNGFLDGLLEAIIRSDRERYAARARQLPPEQPALLAERGDTPLSRVAVERLIEQKSLPMDDAGRRRAQAAAGEYVLVGYGAPDSISNLTERSGRLFIQTSRLYEVQPGLYFDPGGDVVDLRGKPHFRQIPLVRANPLGALPLARYTSIALAALALLSYPIARRTAFGRGGARRPRLRRSLWFLVPAGLLALLVFGVLQAVTGLIYLAWPVPFWGISGWALALLYLPHAGLALAVLAAVLVALAWKEDPAARNERLFLAATTGMLVIFFVMVML
jgi:CubicO group peptidase (beta-lactamase class C family)